MDALITAATTNIAGHLLNDLLVGRRAIFGQQGSRLHYLSCLTEAALRYAQLTPSLLYGVISVRAQTLNCRDGLASNIRDGRQA